MGRISADTTIGRLLELIELLESGQTISIAMVMEKYEVQKQAARRYIDWLGKLKPLQEHRRGHQKLWGLAEQTGDLEKAAALQMATVALADLEGTPVYAQIRKMAQKARNELEPEEVDRLERIGRSFHVLRPERPEAKVRTVAMGRVSEAIRKRERIRFHYRTLDDRCSDYTVEPWSLVLHRGRVLLLSQKCDKDKEIRLFDLDRMTDPQHVPVRAQSLPPEPGRVWEAAFGIYADPRKDPEQVHIRVRNRAAVELESRRVHGSQTTIRTDAEWLDVHMRIVVCEEFTAWLLGLVPDVDVLGPKHLVDDLLRRVQAWSGLKGAK
ncbi:MAG TPA: WYL domain-containing protein [Myxococcota bacterium]|nr:WYL domain-containing protein [Myxococcota bacterium]